MAINALHLQAGQLGRALVSGQGVFVGNAKLVVFKTGGNVGVRHGVHIGVHAQADVRLRAHVQGHGVEHLQLGHALYIEATDARMQGLTHFGRCFAHA